MSVIPTYDPHPACQRGLPHRKPTEGDRQDQRDLSRQALIMSTPKIEVEVP